MSEKTRICIIDQDDMRRLVLEGTLGRAFDVVTLRHPEDLLAEWPHADAALVADEYGYLTQVRDIVLQKRKVLPVIAFGIDIGVDRAMSAIQAGAIDCIDLDLVRRELEARVTLALTRRAVEASQLLSHGSSDDRPAARRAANKITLWEKLRNLLGLSRSENEHPARGELRTDPLFRSEYRSVPAIQPADGAHLL